jgi:hypothetical protein
MSDSVNVDPTTEKRVEDAVAEIEAAVAHPSAAVIDDVFTQHLNTLPVNCEADMRPLIEAARKDLKTRLAAA